MTEPPTSPGLKRVIPRRPLGGCVAEREIDVMKEIAKNSSLHHLPDPRLRGAR